jgi:hypothetical protein
MGHQVNLKAEDDRSHVLLQQLEELKAKRARSSERILNIAQQKGLNPPFLSYLLMATQLLIYKLNLLAALLEELEKTKEDLSKREQKLKRSLQKATEPIEGYIYFDLVIEFLLTFTTEEKNVVLLSSRSLNETSIALETR